MFLLYFFVSKLNGWNDGWICIVTQEAVPHFFVPVVPFPLCPPFQKMVAGYVPPGLAYSMIQSQYCVAS